MTLIGLACASTPQTAKEPKERNNNRQTLLHQTNLFTVDMLDFDYNLDLNLSIAQTCLDFYHLKDYFRFINEFVANSLM